MLQNAAVAESGKNITSATFPTTLPKVRQVRSIQRSAGFNSTGFEPVNFGSIVRLTTEREACRKGRLPLGYRIKTAFAATRRLSHFLAVPSGNWTLKWYKS